MHAEDLAHLYSSLTPYAMTSSGSSAMTDLAASFMRSRALLSFGFSNEYLLANLARFTFSLAFSLRANSTLSYLVKPRPSILTTIHVFGMSWSGCSNCFTYSHLRAGESDGNFPSRWDEMEMKRTLNLPYSRPTRCLRELVIGGLNIEGLLDSLGRYDGRRASISRLRRNLLEETKESDVAFH